jgi:hypothetical protein
MCKKIWKELCCYFSEGLGCFEWGCLFFECLNSVFDVDYIYKS